MNSQQSISILSSFNCPSELAKSIPVQSLILSSHLFFFLLKSKVNKFKFKLHLHQPIMCWAPLDYELRTRPKSSISIQYPHPGRRLHACVTSFSIIGVLSGCYSRSIIIFDFHLIPTRGHHQRFLSIFTRDPSCHQRSTSEMVCLPMSYQHQFWTT